MMALNAKLQGDGGFERQTEKDDSERRTENDDSKRHNWENMVALNANLQGNDKGGNMP